MQLQQQASVEPREAGIPRERLVGAITKAVAEHGYAAFTVERALRNAGVSRAIFDEHFASREQGLVAAQESFLDWIWLEVAGACETAGEWPLKVRAALGAVIASVVETSSLARAFAVEATAASLLAAERQFTALDQFAELLRGGRRLYPDADALPAATERALVGGVASIILDHLFAEDPGGLPAVEPQLVELVLMPYLGEVEARRIAAA